MYIGTMCFSELGCQWPTSRSTLRPSKVKTKGSWREDEVTVFFRSGKMVGYYFNYEEGLNQKNIELLLYISNSYSSSYLIGMLIFL